MVRASEEPSSTGTITRSDKATKFMRHLARPALHQEE
jgi:hypothetical protein